MNVKSVSSFYDEKWEKPTASHGESGKKTDFWFESERTRKKKHATLKTKETDKSHVHPQPQTINVFNTFKLNNCDEMEYVWFSLIIYCIYWYLFLQNIMMLQRSWLLTFWNMSALHPFIPLDICVYVCHN